MAVLKGRFPMQSDPNELKVDDSHANPYRIAATNNYLREHAPLFSTAYWGIAWFLFLCSAIIFVVALISFEFILGIISFWATASTALALGRSAWTNRLVNTLKLDDDRKRIFQDPMSFYGKSVVLGGLTAVASIVVFASICAPLGIGLAHSRIPAFEPRPYWLIKGGAILIVLVSGSAGLLIGYICMLASVPYRRRPDSDSISKSLTPLDEGRDGEGGVYVH